MTFTVLRTSLGAAKLAMKMARETHAAAHERLNFSMRYIELAEKELQTAQEQAAKIIEEKAPEPFHKLGDRYISEKDIQAAISNGIQTATQELIAKLAALDAPKKGKA